MMRAKLKILVTVFFMALVPVAAQACSCAMSDMKESYDSSDVIFSGLVTNIENVNYQFKVTFEVIDGFKEANQHEITVFTAENSAACGYNFESDQEYLVYATTLDDGRYYASLCSRTVPLDQAESDIEALKEIQ